MAVTFTAYNTSVKRLVNKEVDYTNLRVMLLDNTAAFTAGDTSLDQVAGTGHTKEISGNGWTIGGETLSGVAVTVISTNDAKLDANDVTVTASGGPIGPAYAAVVYDDTDANDAPLFYIDFGGAQTAGDTTDFKIVWHVNGLVSFTY